VTREPGCLIDTSECEVVVLAFVALSGQAGAAVRVGGWPHAASASAQALKLWRGTPLADVPSQLLRDEWTPVLEQQRLQALEGRIEADLHLGHHDGVVP
jgi:hypothetical protein